ncbi:hypothetical protein CQ018_08775 [Arthrobacter sp. MYb227]|nr:hypothetical protein CQ018_08775 [Arthrobacter sp. MYb227]
MILEPKLPAKSIRSDSCGSWMLAFRLEFLPSRNSLLSSLNLRLLSRVEITICIGACSLFPAVVASHPLWINMEVMVFLEPEVVRTIELGKASLRSSWRHANMGI